MEEEGEASLPPGWKRSVNDRRRIQYDSPPPVTHIRSKGQLLRYQKQGKFLDLDANQVDFLVKKKKAEKTHVILQQNPTEPSKSDDETDTDVPTDTFESTQPVVEPLLYEVPLFAIPPQQNIFQAHTNDAPTHPEQSPMPGSSAAPPHSHNAMPPTSPSSQVSFSDLADPCISSKLKTIDHDLNKINAAVKLLTIDPTENLDHKKELKEAAKLLNEARLPPNLETGLDLEDLKLRLVECKDLEALVHQLWVHAEAKNIFQQMEMSSTLEDFLKMGRSDISGPLKTFPPCINENIYHEIIKFAIDKSKNTVLFLLNLLVEKNKPVSTQDVIQISYIISYLAHSVNRENDALVKLKSLLVQKEGITNEGLDTLAVLGVTESSRSLRNQKDFLAGISSELVKSAAKSYPHHSTIDNIDLKIDEVSHHMTLEYIEVEQFCTKNLSTGDKSLGETLEFFKKESVLLSTEANKDLLNHLRKVVAISVGRNLAERVPGAGFLKKLLKNHYDHPTSKQEPKPAITFVKKPQYLHEMKNNDMIKICKKLQLDFLELTAELVPNKGAFLADLEVVQDIDSDKIEREAAEKRLHEEVKAAGEFIGHGDQMTFQKFFDAKRLCRTGVTALERLEYVHYFRLALFHTKMNKVFMDYKTCMISDENVNVDDVLTLSWFKAYLGGFDSITNQESKIKKPGSFELHDQFITELGLQFLTNAFENFLEMKGDTLKVESELDAQQLILDFLQENGIAFYFDPENSNEKDKFDDLLTYCRDLSSRTVLSIVSDKLEEESDALGMKAFRISMIIYFLNRKQNVQDSKYAYSLLLDLVLELKASERTKQRMDNLVCVNVRGKNGEGIHRDKKCEHFVREVKNALKGTHSSLKDSCHYC